MDCPNMGELQLSNCEDGVKGVFADIAAMAADCKFANCQHQAEPDCAITNGSLDQRRFSNFQKILKEQDRNSRTLAESHQQDKKPGKLIKSVQSAKREKFEDWRTD